MLTTALEFYASPCYWVFLKALKGVTLLQSYRRDLLEDKGKRAREALYTIGKPTKQEPTREGSDG